MSKSLPSTTINSSGFWSATVNIKEELTLMLGSELRLTHVSIGELSIKSLARTSLVMVYTPSGSGERPTSVVLGSLIPSRSEQFSCDLALLQGQRFSFRVVGGNSVHLSGYFRQDGTEPSTVTEIQRRPLTINALAQTAARSRPSVAGPSRQGEFSSTPNNVETSRSQSGKRKASTQPGSDDSDEDEEDEEDEDDTHHVKKSRYS